MTVELNVGSLRHQVTLQSIGNRVDDGYGGGSLATTDVATVWAKIEPLTGDELLTAQQFAPTATFRITIRYLADIRPSMRVVFGSRVFDVKYVANIDERNRKIELLCEEIVTW